MQSISPEDEIRIDETYGQTSSQLQTAALYSDRSILLSFFVTTSKEKIMYVLIAASVFSNIADRLLYDGVIDYIKLGNAIVFNLADVFILSGIVLLFSNKIFILMSKTK